MPSDALSILVRFYRDADGSKPVAEFLRGIDRSNPRLAARIKEELRQLQDRRYHGLPHTRPIGGRPGLFELRVRGHDDARLLFFFGAEREIVIVHGFVKKSQSIPPAELDVAMARKGRHEQREKGTAR